MNTLAIEDSVKSVLGRIVGSQTPGLQYVVVAGDRTLFEQAAGWADVKNEKAMTLEATLMAYSMTKTFTAVAILQLAEREKLEVDHELDQYLPDTPYRGHAITLRQLLTHTSGIPNPIPLRWAHLAEEAADFDEDKALAEVLDKNPRLAFKPGERFAYSNIGYWLLGKIVERVTGGSYVDYVRGNVLDPLGLKAVDMDFVIPDPARHANGYLAKYSLLNLIKGLVTDRRLWGETEGKWLRLRSHHLNGPAFGGLIGTARGFSRFLQDQLRPESALFNSETKRLLETQQTDGAGRPVPMTLGWHLGDSPGAAYRFKEGGGGGFHSEMRIYPAQGIGTVVMVNSTEFNSTAFLNRVDRAALR